MKHGKLKESLISLDFNDQQNAKSQSRSTQKLDNVELFNYLYSLNEIETYDSTISF